MNLGGVAVDVPNPIEADDIALAHCKRTELLIKCISLTV